MNLFWIILVIIVLLLILKWRSMSNPKNFAKGVSKAQLKAYQTAQIRHPNASKAELITEAISSRLNVSSYYPTEIIKQDAEKHESYRYCMHLLIVLEFKKLTGNMPTLDVQSLMHEQIDSIIPEDL